MSQMDLEELARRQAEAMITRREAVRRVSMLLGGVALVGGNALITGCRDDRQGANGQDSAAATVEFTNDEVAFLDEVADTILPETSTPGAKAAKTGAFMALMVRDTYDEREQQVFRDGMRRLDEACQQMHQVGFMRATPQQRLALLERIDREQFDYMRQREAAGAAAIARADTTEADTTSRQDAASRAGARLPDQRSETPQSGESNPAPAITADAPPHYFRMMKELALLGYFTSEIGYTQAMRYRETPGRFDPCAPYTPGEKAWAPHA